MLAPQSSMGLAFGTRAAALLLGVSLAFAAGMGPARADKVGVAAAVEPDAFSSLSGTPNQQLNIGKSIFYNERINTTTSGLVQVLLIDGSTFTVGPNSDLVIDKFVYDPNKKTGQLVATFTKGTMRFIGGKLSKNEGGVKVNTPAGALAIHYNNANPIILHQVPQHHDMHVTPPPPVYTPPPITNLPGFPLTHRP
jgi:hypothetical protein